jgi:hypothetical protein
MYFKFLTVDKFVVPKSGENLFSIQANTVPIRYVITPVCRAKAAVRRFLKSEQEKYMFRPKSGTYFQFRFLKI